MPVWQQLYDELSHADSKAEVLSVALDVQGATFARPFVEKAGAEFCTLIDRENLLGKLYRFKAVPNGFLINEDGIIDYMRLGGFDIRERETRGIVTDWITHGRTDTERQDVGGLRTEHDEAISLFEKGAQLFGNGHVEQALRFWYKAIELEPDNYIIRKQVWAIENPDRFYESNVDFDWQRERIKNECQYRN